MIQYAAIGIILGLSAGFAPGPLLALVISETLKHDVRSGIRVALAPLITDLPIVILSVFVLSGLSQFHFILGCISIVGSFVIMGMGIKGFKTKGLDVQIYDIEQKSLTNGMLVNILSPHPYLFWFSVGAPTMARANEIHLSAAIAFVVCFYLLLIGSKIFLAVLAGQSKSFLKEGSYILVMKFLGAALCGLAMLLFKEGLSLMGLV